MNASAYLQAQGWRGTGFSLDHNNRGLAKPLLVSQKTDQTGLGTKKHDFKDQWWNSAFDRSLKSLGGAGGNAPTTIEPVQTPIKYTNPVVAKYAGLYNRFRKSEVLEGTFTPPSELESEEMSRTKKSKPGYARRKEVEAQRAAQKQQESSLPLIEERESTGPILGVPPHDSTAEVQAGRDAGSETDKKRKHTPSGAEISSKKKQKRVSFADTDGGLPLPPATPSEDVKERNRAARRERKAANKEASAERRKASTESAQQTSKKSKERKRAAVDKAQAAGLGRSPSPDADDPSTALIGEPHEESIFARRNAGEKVDLPGDAGDPDELRANLVRLYEQGDEKSVKKILSDHFPRPEEELEPDAKKNKTAKYDRERLKREAKRDARHWVEVRKLTHLYRADGSYIESKERGVPPEEVKARRQAKKEEKKSKASGKEANKLDKQEKNAAKRTERQMKRAEKKQKNHEGMMANISSKKRRERDEQEAKAVGKSYDELVKVKAGQLKGGVEEYKREGRKQLLEKATAAGGDLSAVGVLGYADADAPMSASDFGKKPDDSQRPAISDDFIPVHPTEPSESTSASQMGFMIDTTGDSQLAPTFQPGPVTKATSTTRSERLNAKKQPRAERDAARAAAKISKKGRKAQKGAKKEEKIGRMIGDILARDGAKGPEATAAARREARRVFKGLKKGKLKEEEVLPQWRGLVKSQGKIGKYMSSAIPVRP